MTMTAPLYSKLLSRISSHILDKSSDVLIQLKTDLKLTFSSEAYMFLMKVNALNTGFTDT